MLHLVKTQGRPRRRRAAEDLQCPRCKGREVIETRIGVQIIDGKPRGGTRVICCAACHRKGERVALA